MDKEYIIVRSKESLEKAIEDNVENIVIKGELAEEVNAAMNQATLKSNNIGTALILGAVALAAAPFTGGGSAIAGASSIAAISGLTATTTVGVTAIAAVSFLGAALILSITNGYDRKVTAKAKGLGEATLELKKK